VYTFFHHIHLSTFLSYHLPHPTGTNHNFIPPSCSLTL
jgi:hypothetical protein